MVPFENCRHQPREIFVSPLKVQCDFWVYTKWPRSPLLDSSLLTTGKDRMRWTIQEIILFRLLQSVECLLMKNASKKRDRAKVMETGKQGSH